MGRSLHDLARKQDVLKCREPDRIPDLSRESERCRRARSGGCERDRNGSGILLPGSCGQGPENASGGTKGEMSCRKKHPLPFFIDIP